MGKREKLFKKVTIAELYIYNDIIHVAVALEIVLRNITHRVSNVERRSSLVCCGTTKNGTQFIARNFALYVPAWLVFSKKNSVCKAVWPVTKARVSVLKRLQRFRNMASIFEQGSGQSTSIYSFYKFLTGNQQNSQPGRICFHFSVIV